MKVIARRYESCGKTYFDLYPVTRTDKEGHHHFNYGNTFSGSFTSREAMLATVAHYGLNLVGEVAA